MIVFCMASFLEYHQPISRVECSDWTRRHLSYAYCELSEQHLAQTLWLLMLLHIHQACSELERLALPGRRQRTLQPVDSHGHGGSDLSRAL